MKELGEYLHDTRCENGVSLDEAATDLGVLVDVLENIESANTKAFKDIYYLKNLIKEYAKYLGLDGVKIQEEFNDFLFEHTSKISLDDIREAQAKKEEELKDKAKQIHSPYTKVYKEKFNKMPIIFGILIVIFLIVIAFFLVRIINRKPAISSELKGECFNECTY